MLKVQRGTQESFLWQLPKYLKVTLFLASNRYGIDDLSSRVRLLSCPVVGLASWDVDSRLQFVIIDCLLVYYSSDAPEVYNLSVF